MNLDQHVVKIPCPACGQQLPKTLGELKAVSELTCVACGNGFAFQAADIGALAQEAIKEALKGWGRSS